MVTATPGTSGCIYIYNKALCSYTYICINIYISSIAGQTAGLNLFNNFERIHPWVYWRCKHRTQNIFSMGARLFYTFLKFQGQRWALYVNGGSNYSCEKYNLGKAEYSSQYIHNTSERSRGLDIALLTLNLAILYYIRVH